MRLSADRARWFVPDLFVRERRARWPWRPASAECPSGRSERDPWRCEAESTALCSSRWGEPPCGPASRPLVSAWGTATSPYSAATSRHTLSSSYSAEALINRCDYKTPFCWPQQCFLAVNWQNWWLFSCAIVKLSRMTRKRIHSRNKIAFQLNLSQATS